MSKRLRTLLLLAAIAVVIGGGAAWLLCSMPAEEEEPAPTTQTEDESISILNKTMDADGSLVSSPVKTLHIQNASGDFTIAPREDGSLSVTDYIDLPVDTMAINSICTGLADLKADAVIEKTETDEAYGFDQPTATVEATFHDDTTATVLFGRKTPTETGYYCRKQGDDALYIVDTDCAEQFQWDALSFIGKSLIVAPSVDADDNEGIAQLLRLWLTGRAREQAIEIKVDTEGEYRDITTISAFVMTAPFTRAVDSDLLTEMSAQMKTLTAVGVAAAHPDEATLASFGLADPYSTAAFTLAVVRGSEDDAERATHYNDREHMILLGNRDADGNYYALVDGINVVYLLSSDSVPWAESSYIDLTSKLLFLRDITTVSAVTVSENGEDTVYELAHFPDKEKKDEQLVVTSNGSTLSTSEFRILYQYMISIRRVADPEPDAQASGTPLLALTLSFLDGSEPMSVSFYPMTASRYLCVTDDGEQTAVSIAKAEDFLRQLHNYQTGQPVTSPY